MGNFNVTIAAESFIKDDSVFFLPGASLETSDRRTSQLEDDRLSFQDYYDGKYASQLENVLKPAKNAQDWVKLEPAECVSMYAPRECSGLRDYRDVVVVVKAVILSVLLKVVTCITVIRVLGPEESLVTPGDAICSFISVPESKSYDSGPVKQDHIREKARRKQHIPVYVALSTTQWVHQETRKGSSVPWKVWAGSYSILVLGIAISGACFAVQRKFNIPLQWVKLNVGETRSVLRGITSRTTFISSMLIANSPQLYLSFWYLAYNSLVTRLEMGYEWALFSVEYRSLRVTHPKGQQTSTYRLQLPYRYSTPLLLMSTLLHWLVSTALFVIVTRGGNTTNPTSDVDYQDKVGIDAGYLTDTITLPDDATVSIGTSSLPVLILTILAATMTLIPIAMARVKLPGYMPVVGSNSQAMLAASRPSSVAKIPEIPDLKSDNAGGIELEQLIPASKKSSEEARSLFAPKNMAFCLLKWGEVEMPEDWYRRFDEASDGHHPGLRVRHLSFGTILDDPKPPTEGYLYA
ncbi:hypothetical protein CSOJ01_07821 [Colletotrichum sojae]|uniref:Uncharacterized protein n=1 Tax=Colletotrichum sojae TaxID=2175907 RepID=A0A8H6J8A9_9PEZI|nr:hypothetical protein CSOJ01_07821 [Colletotrichum sojae]